MSLPEPPKEAELVKSEFWLILKSRMTLSLLGLVILAQLFPLISYGSEIYLPIRISLWVMLSLSLWFQARILFKHRNLRRMRRWRNWQQQRFLLLRGRVDSICANGGLHVRDQMQELLVARGRLVALLEDGSVVLKNEELDYQVEFDRLAAMSLNALEESGNSEPLKKILILAKQLEEEIPVALADTWDSPSFDEDDFERKLVNFRGEHVVKVGVNRRGREAGKK